MAKPPTKRKNTTTLRNTESILRRPKNADVREREYLRPNEVNRLIDAAKSIGRNRARDALLIMMMFRHGLRVNEVVDLKWTNIDWTTAHIHINRLKQGSPSVQPIEGKEMRLLRVVERSQGQERLPWIFISERRAPLTDHTVRKIVTRAGELAGFEFPVHPHMLRHSCGYYLASKGYDTRLIQDYLGHKQIQHTVKYTQLAPNRFNVIRWD